MNKGQRFVFENNEVVDMLERSAYINPTGLGRVCEHIGRMPVGEAYTVTWDDGYGFHGYTDRLCDFEAEAFGAQKAFIIIKLRTYGGVRRYDVMRIV